MASIDRPLLPSAETGTHLFRMILMFVVVGAIGVTMGVVVNSPNKRLIEAVGAGIFLLVAFGVDISFSLGVLFALFPFPAGMSFATSNEALIFMLLIVYALKQMLRREPILKRSPLDLPILVILGATVVSIFRYDGGSKTLELHLRSFFSAVVLYYIVVSSCTRREQFNRLLAGFVIAIAAAAFVGMLQMFFPGRTLIPEFIYVPEEARYEKYVRAAGTFGNYSVFGQYMALSTMLVSHLFIRSRSIYAKMVYMAVLLAVAATFVSAAMRGALFALVLGFLYMGMVGRGEVKIRHLLTMVVIIGVLFVMLAGMMLTYLGTGYMFERLQGFSLQRGSPTSRMETNKFFFNTALNHPLFGHGPAITLDLGIAGARTNNPHCQYLYYLYTIGFVGLAGFVWLLVKLWAYSLRAIRTRRMGADSIRGFLVVFHAMLVVFAIHELIDDYMVVRLYHHIIWGMFAILVVLSRMTLEEESGSAARTSTVGARLLGRMSAG